MKSALNNDKLKKNDRPHHFAYVSTIIIDAYVNYETKITNYNSFFYLNYSCLNFIKSYFCTKQRVRFKLSSDL